MPASEYVRNLRHKIGNDLLQVPSVSVLIFSEDGRVLLVRQAENNLWSTPGGMVEPHETPSDAALREAWEETGLRVRLERIVGVFGGENCRTRYANGDNVSWISTAFKAVIVSGEARPDNVETQEVRYFSREELNGVRCTPHVRQFLDVAWSHPSTTYFQPPTWSPTDRASPGAPQYSG